MTCPNCGKETYEGALFCTGCGARLNIITEAPAENADALNPACPSEAVSPAPECAEFVCADDDKCPKPTETSAEPACDGLAEAAAEPSSASEGIAAPGAPIPNKVCSNPTVASAPSSSPVPPSVSAPAKPKETQQDIRPLSTWSFIWREFIFFIPIVNIIVLFVMAFANGINVNSRSFARSRLIYMLIFTLLFIAAAVFAVIHINSISMYLNQWIRS